jgi:hypothetical protein
MNAAQSFIAQEHARAIVSLCQLVPTAYQPFPDNRPLAAIVGMLVPTLLAKSSQIVVVQGNHVAATALAAAGAIPAFDNRQDFDRQRHGIRPRRK